MLEKDPKNRPDFSYIKDSLPSISQIQEYYAGFNDNQVIDKAQDRDLAI